MKSRLVLVLAIMLSNEVAHSQVATFTRHFGGPKYDAAFCVEPLGGGGYILAGTTYTLTGQANNVFVVRTNCSGDTLWTRSIGGSGNDDGFSVCGAYDGGFIIAGTKTALPADTVSVYVIKLDSAGTVGWSKTLRRSAKDYAYSVCATADSGFAVAGTMGSGPRGQSDGLLIKLDRWGDTVWTRTYGGAAGDGLHHIVALPDNGFLLAGFTGSYGGGLRDFYSIRTNANGDTLWTRTYGGADDETGWSADVVPDSGFILGGIVSKSALPTQTSEFLLVRIDGHGDTLWTKTMDSVLNEGSASVHYTQDGGFALVGTTIAVDPRGDVVFLKTDRSGAVQWRRTFGGPIDDNGSCVHQCQDGGYILAGMVCENTYDAYLVKTDEWGLVTMVKGEEPRAVPPLFQLSQNYPNPFNPATTISFDLLQKSFVSLKVFDALGRETAILAFEELPAGGYTRGWDASGKASGIYFCRLHAGSFTTTKKLVLLK